MTSDLGGRMCVSCGRSIPRGANVCPYCGYDFRIPNVAPYGNEGPSSGLRLVLYILSFLFWIAGIVIWVVYRSRPDPESQHVGKVCLMLGIISIVLNFGLAALLYVMVLGFGAS
jgi:hypothetical protein